MSTAVLFRLLLPAALLLAGCTTSQETRSEETSVRQRVPNRILTDADRQAAYNSNAGYGGATPDATPGRVRPGEQASGINSQKNPESLNTDNNNTATPETRLRRVKGAPADTLRLP
ncbi:hypothetical protein [Hymenobacter psychrophilus]|uniref:Lipoprotein n=1 Tax=Hymenobacter psychrophilus TaxID=651662 RepID=A0A1H3E7J2_9BACT|nr:hypothetical protein [Hymenobacter psychrophilus]SDX74570.1 hypothetical protein SAMN04488069_10311 [Hymenobacter psychrophilus]